METARASFLWLVCVVGAKAGCMVAILPCVPFQGTCEGNGQIFGSHSSSLLTLAINS